MSGAEDMRDEVARQRATGLVVVAAIATCLALLAWYNTGQPSQECSDAYWQKVRGEELIRRERYDTRGDDLERYYEAIAFLAKNCPDKLRR